MTLVEKYPFCWQSILQITAQEIVNQIHRISCTEPIDVYTIKVKLDPDIWSPLSTRQRDYFISLFGGIFCITKLIGYDGDWLCVHRPNIPRFHYHAPLRVHPKRVTNNTKNKERKSTNHV